MDKFMIETYKAIMVDFVKLLHDKNPNLKIGFATSFDGVEEKYKEGKFVARAHKQAGSPEFVLLVNDDFDLPYELYRDMELRCTSWRNNGFNGGLAPEDANQQREKLPKDFDVVSICGTPLSGNRNCAQLSLYIVGGCAKAIDKERTSNIDR